jgi:uroporphyrinogen-III synthase
MPECSLHGAGVLVTRPEHQAFELNHAVAEAGGIPVSFPVLTIEALPKNSVEQQLGDLAGADIAIFVSANAVEHGLGFISNPLTRIAAVGPATARALRSAGREVDIVPERGFDSEHLLEEPELNDVSGKHICIVRGEDGRELLAATLRERGARVSYLPVYRRCAVKHSAERLAELEADWRSGRINRVVAMSVASLDSLVASLPDYCRESLKSMPIVTPSPRVQQRCEELGIGNPAIVSDGPQASAIIRALITCQ